jgi:hypothetical protein
MDSDARGANLATRPEGFEPPTDGLEIRCSILLSYGRKQRHNNELCQSRMLRIFSGYNLDYNQSAMYNSTTSYDSGSDRGCQP